jgi:hypothetical protein
VVQQADIAEANWQRTARHGHASESRVAEGSSCPKCPAQLMYWHPQTRQRRLLSQARNPWLRGAPVNRLNESPAGVEAQFKCVRAGSRRVCEAVELLGQPISIERPGTKAMGGRIAEHRRHPIVLVFGVMMHLPATDEDCPAEQRKGDESDDHGAKSR